MPVGEYHLQGGMIFGVESYKNGTSQDLHMRLQVPEHFGWGAVGIGQGMIGSTVFMTYATKDGKSSTLSVRAPVAHAEPPPLDAQPCRTQRAITSGGTIDTSFVCYGYGDKSKLVGPMESTDWIFSTGPGLPVRSNSNDAQVSQHIVRGYFNVDIASAQGQGSPPPFIPIGPGSSIGPGGTVGSVSTPPQYGLVKTHAVLLGGSFLLLFPLGVFLLRLRSTRLHWISQMTAFLLSVIGFIIAIYMSASTTTYHAFNEAHQILGLITVSLLFPQALLGFLNHKKFKSTNKSSWMALPHVNLGRIIIILGMVNGILGFRLYGDNTGAIAFGVVAGVVLLSIVALTIFDLMRKSKRASSSGNAVTAPTNDGKQAA